jgi:hypothetical protein
MLWLWSACGTADAGRQTEARPQAASAFGSTTVDSAFWAHWGDGKAELAHYALTIPRYGELRTGTAVWVFVTEDFTEQQRVKSDGGHPDEFPVLKHNDVRHFQTGIYDYEVMTSTFTRIDGRDAVGLPTKVSLGVQEWCGHVYTQLVARAGVLDFTGHSYFDGEGDQQQALTIPGRAVLLDQLPTLARGLTGAWPAPGRNEAVQLLDRLDRQRYSHQPPRWVAATVTRGVEVAAVTVPAGTFDATTVTMSPTSGPSYTWQVEVASPHRIVRWTTSDGELGELVASVRAPYWDLHSERDEPRLGELGLTR